jgi:hypothetical protein
LGTSKSSSTETICQEADRLVSGDRQRDYGHPLDAFIKTAAVWTAILGDKLTKPITAEEASLCLVGLKVVRETNTPKRDNRVDIAGYAKVLDLIVEERERRESHAKVA